MERPRQPSRLSTFKGTSLKFRAEGHHFYPTFAYIKVCDGHNHNASISGWAILKYFLNIFHISSGKFTTLRQGLKEPSVLLRHPSAGVRLPSQSKPRMYQCDICNPSPIPYSPPLLEAQLFPHPEPWEPDTTASFFTCVSKDFNRAQRKGSLLSEFCKNSYNILTPKDYKPRWHVLQL